MSKTFNWMKTKNKKEKSQLGLMLLNFGQPPRTLDPLKQMAVSSTEINFYF